MLYRLSPPGAPVFLHVLKTYTLVASKQCYCFSLTEPFRHAYFQPADTVGLQPFQKQVVQNLGGLYVWATPPHSRISVTHKENSGVASDTLGTSDPRASPSRKALLQWKRQPPRSFRPMDYSRLGNPFHVGRSQTQDPCITSEQRAECHTRNGTRQASQLPVPQSHTYPEREVEPDSCGIKQG